MIDGATLREDERWAYRVLEMAVVELVDQPLGDEVGLARARKRYAEAKDNWASALQALDQFRAAFDRAAVGAR